MLVALLCTLSLSAWGQETWELVTDYSSLSTSDTYVIAGNIKGGSTWYSLKNNQVTSNTNLPVGSALTISNNKITSTISNDETWLIETTSTSGVYYIKSTQGSYYLQNESNTGSKITSKNSTDGQNQWRIHYQSSNSNNTVTGLYNVGVSRELACYSTANWRCYASANYNNVSGAEVVLYKKVLASVSNLSISTAPSKLNYKAGEKLDLTGLVLNADGSNVTSGYTAKIGETTVTSGTTVLNEVGAKTITFTYGGQECTQTIHVGALQSISVTTPPTKTSYDEGQSFNSEGMVVKATYSDEETTPTTWQETITEYSYRPSGALSPSNTEITISYSEKTTTQAITVTAGVPYTVSFSAGTGSCGTASINEASFGTGVELPSATIGLSGWTFAGWAEAATANTAVAPTIYAAGSTYYPTDNTTLYAVYKYDALTNNYALATSMSDLENGAEVVISSLGSFKYTLANDAGTLTGFSNFTPTDNVITCTDSKAVWTLSKVGNNYTMLNSSKYFAYSSSTVTLSDDSYQWVIEKAKNGSGNKFLIRDTDNKQYCIEHNGTSWILYNTAKDDPTTDQVNKYVGLTFYVRQGSVAYNSNPAAIINPTIAFTTAGDKKLYVQNENTYTNAANVTGIAKTPVYTSSNATVATVSETGVVTALKAGSATITATVAAETGLNTEASVSYDVTVKDASNIAGVKDLTSSATEKPFEADWTDAVVTYVKDNYAYIQDGSAAIKVNFKHSLVAGNKINGAVSGTVKASNAIDRIIDLNLEGATVTADGIIPAATTLTIADIKASSTTYDGKLVTVVGAKVTTSPTNANSIGAIKDGGSDDLTLYAPNAGITVNRYEEGSFTGFISLYGGSAYRLNIFEQSQIVLTKNAPTAQNLTFAEDAVVLDEETDGFDNFNGQVVTGAQGTVSYAINGDAIGTVNASTGAVTLNGTCGTATITATAAATSMTEEGVTTPYTETTKSYTVTVRPRYTVTFSVNGVETPVRETSYGAGVTVPANPSAIGSYTFQGWNSTEVTTTDSKPDFASLTAGATYEPSGNETYYAVYATQTVVSNQGTSTFNFKTSSTPSSPYVDNEGSWTWSNITCANSNNCGFGKKNNASITFTPSENVTSITSVSITKCAQAWGSATLVLVDKDKNTIASIAKSDMQNGDTSSEGTNTVSLTNNQSTSYTISNNTSANAWVKTITFNYVYSQVTSAGYTTTVTVPASVSAAGYATFCSTAPLDFTGIEGIYAYIASVNDKNITFTRKNKIPANTGVLLRSVNSGAVSEDVPVLSGDADDVDGNVFVGATADIAALATVDGDYTNYILNNGSNGIGFYEANGQMVGAGKAYLHVNTASGVRGFISFTFNDENTGIANVEGNTQEGTTFDLQGRRVNEPKHGLYIINGKKMFIK